MELPKEFQLLAIALGLGLLVGLQRERTVAGIAGFRTFPIVAIFGTLCGILAAPYGGWTVAAGLLATAAIVIVGNVAKWHAGQVDPGLTTEMALLAMFVIGAYLATGHAAVAVVVTATLAVLLHLKPQLHGLAQRIGDKDFRAIMQFVVIALVILPVLPDAKFGPFGVLNPHRIWWMVVLISGISLAGYVAYKWLGDRGGAIAGGLLGGLISSTATTASYARRSREAHGSPALIATVIMLASSIVFIRVIIAVAIVVPQQLLAIAPPLAVMFGVMALLSVVVWFRARRQQITLPEQTNPTELKSALVFTVLFTLVLLAVGAAKEYLGSRGLYGVAVLSGLTDMDAITLSTSQIIGAGQLDTTTGWRLILVGSLANLVFKAATVSVLGTRELAWRIWALFLAALAAGGAVLVFWPG